MKLADAKLQRWIDLIAALLTYRFGATFADLERLVPAYGAARNADTLARMFERDKDELRALGLPIRVRHEDAEEGSTQRYYMRAREMYLPFLALSARATQYTGARDIPGTGYRDIPTLAFEPDELSTLVRAARCAKQIGDAALTRDVESAIAKLTYDLGLGAALVEPDENTVRTSESDTAPAVSILGEALLRRKRVTFEYRSMTRDVVEERNVEPYGLAFTSAHWYLVGRDVDAGALRKFRVSRMQQVRANAKRPQSLDYTIPPDFHLAAHARARESWELGDESDEEMIIEILGESGSAAAARSLGLEVLGAPSRRRFQVRRVDSFARWIMSFAGEIVPISPPRLCACYDEVLLATRRVYDRDTNRVDA